MIEPTLPHFLIAAPLDEVKQIARWGTYGHDGKQPLKWVRLIDLSTNHLKAILLQPHVSRIQGLEWIINSILQDRGSI